MFDYTPDPKVTVAPIPVILWYGNNVVAVLSSVERRIFCVTSNILVLMCWLAKYVDQVHVHTVEHRCPQVPDSDPRKDLLKLR